MADGFAVARVEAGRQLLAAREYTSPTEITTRLTTAIILQASEEQLRLAHELLSLDSPPDATAGRDAYLQWVRDSGDPALGTRIADATAWAIEEIHHRNVGPHVHDERQRVHLRPLMDAGYRPSAAEAEDLAAVSSTKH